MSRRWPYLLALFLAIEVVVLVQRERSLKAELHALQDRLVEMRASIPEVGVDAARFELVSTAGDTVAIGGEGIAPSFLVFFSTTCPACEDDAAVWGDLHRDYGASGVRFVGVCVEEGEEDVEHFARAHGVEFPVVRGEAPEVSDAYRVDFFPKRVVVSAGGRIVHADGKGDPVGPDAGPFLREILDRVMDSGA